MPSKDKYTDPDLREQVKEEVKESDKGGAPGQWSARKAQFMASEYKKRGGGYTTDKEHGQDDSQKNLENWGNEEWQTKEGSGAAKQEDGSRKRYLPKKAWEQLDEKEKEETDQKKQAESRGGKQFVGNTSKAKAARKNVSEAGGQQQSNSKKGKASQGEKGKNSQDEDSDEEEEQDYKDDEGDEDDDFQEEADEADEDDKAEPETDSDAEDNEATGQKRTRTTSDQESAPSKKQKSSTGKGKQANGKPNGTMGSKHDSTDAPAPQGSSGRLPNKGQKVTWKAMPGWVHGEVLEVVTSNKTLEGKSVKASKKDPRIALRAESGKFCVHKPDACYFEDE